ncbi:hypothetical protein PIB30_085800 [Stylosanthes scabra]|uniref:Uncharacterized protein n=1 Tax=Stylosanthes scabra TaxID=79078 RepID=A0ABU6TV81_9FABA|nr:hypothetical protein [Stylosanthes scabra]
MECKCCMKWVGATRLRCLRLRIQKRHVNDLKGLPYGANEHDLEGRLSTNKFSRRGGKKGRLQAIDISCFSCLLNITGVSLDLHGC